MVENNAKCPVCGGPLHKAESFEICHICGWEDDNINREFPDYDGINPMSLNEAKKAWAEGKTIYKGFPNPKGKGL